MTSYTDESIDPVIELGPETEIATHDAIIGLTTTETGVYATKSTVDLPTGAVGGEGLSVTMDFQPRRITAEVKNDVVVRYAIE